MAYSLQTYVDVGNIQELKKRQLLLKPLLSVYSYQLDLLTKPITDPEWAKQEEKKIRDKLEDLRLDDDNITIAIELLARGYNDDDD